VDHGAEGYARCPDAFRDTARSVRIAGGDMDYLTLQVVQGIT
jgi:hypothetical protein